MNDLKILSDMAEAAIDDYHAKEAYKMEDGVDHLWYEANGKDEP